MSIWDWFMGEKEIVRLDRSQFDDLKNSAHDIREHTAQTTRILHGGVQNAIREAAADVVEELRKASTPPDLTELLVVLNRIAAAIENTQQPAPPAKLGGIKFVFKVQNNHPAESFSLNISGVTDAEGEPIADPSGLISTVESSDPSVVGVTFDPATKSGEISFGTSGVASVTASVSNAAGEILGSGAADFTVTTGDPAAVSDVSLSFPNLTEEP
jgi:hypothetical protein